MCKHTKPLHFTNKNLAVTAASAPSKQSTEQAENWEISRYTQSHKDLEKRRKQIQLDGPVVNVLADK